MAPEALENVKAELQAQLEDMKAATLAEAEKRLQAEVKDVQGKTGAKLDKMGKRFDEFAERLDKTVAEAERSRELTKVDFGGLKKAQIQSATKTLDADRQISELRDGLEDLEDKLEEANVNNIGR